jgi:hypothetical protein
MVTLIVLCKTVVKNMVALVLCKAVVKNMVRLLSCARQW